MTDTTGYNANEMTHLEGLDAVRKRPGMYIGSTDTKGMTHLAYEIIDNAVDEAIAGHCTKINVTLFKDGSVEVADNGRGIPVDIHTKTGLPAVIGVFALLHFGGKFGGGSYQVSGGLHGVGSSVVNALSARLDVQVARDGHLYEASFSRGPVGTFDGPGVNATFTPGGSLRDAGPAAPGQTGTIVRFWPDPVIFLKDAYIDTNAVIARARRTAFLVPGLTVEVADLRHDTPTNESFCFTGGIADMVDYLSPDKALCDTVYLTGRGKFTETVPVLDQQGHMVNSDVERNVEVTVALRWGTGYDSTVHSFVNVVSTPNGGTHVKGFERALIQTLRKGYEGTRILRQSEEPPTLDDAMEGITAVISVGVPEPQFVGQTKEELGTAGVTKVVQDVVTAGVKEWLEGKKKAQARLVLEKVANAARTRIASRTQRDAARRKTALESAAMPAKLVDCRATGVDRSELFIVEGDSALGSARQGRNSEYQALLPIRGKILNVQKASTADMLKNAECSAIIQVVGAGSGRSFDITQMRYGRVIIMADADVDGSHIRTLLLVLFWKYMRPVIEEGRLYAAMPPLHKVETTGRNAQSIYTYTQAEMEKTVADLEKAGKTVKKPIQRFKGLGEMNSELLWSSTLDPAARSVRQITVEDAEEAAAMLELLMGDDVAPRRNWLIDNSHRVDTSAIDA